MGQANWFAQWLRQDYASRTDAAVDFVVEERRKPRKMLLLNCLDRLYGHSLLKLLNVQYYLDHRPDVDVVVLVPAFLRWIVPEGVAAVWTVGGDLARFGGWNDALGTTITNLCRDAEECWLSVALSHPHPRDFDIERFTGVSPFETHRWDATVSKPQVTFVWRQDRLWSPSLISAIGGPLSRVRLGLDHKAAVQLQRHRVLSLGKRLRRTLPVIDFAIVGLGSPVQFPDWIEADITMTPDAEVERRWCHRYSTSHVVVGVHGSNMLLPSAHAAAVVELMPEDRWGNVVQDLLSQTDDAREALFRYRTIPASVHPDDCASVVLSLLDTWEEMTKILQAGATSRRLREAARDARRRG